MSTEPIAPSAEDKARYDAARKELVAALSKKRAVDKSLVCRLKPQSNSLSAYLIRFGYIGPTRGSNIQPRRLLSDRHGGARWW